MSQMVTTKVYLSTVDNSTAAKFSWQIFHKIKRDFHYAVKTEFLKWPCFLWMSLSHKKHVLSQCWMFWIWQVYFHSNNWRQRMPKRQDPYMWRWLRTGDCWEVLQFHRTTVIQSFRMTHLTFVKSIGPLVVPATLCPREPLPTCKLII